MAGRNHYHHEAYENRRVYLQGGPPSLALMPPHPAMLEEELEIQHHEIRRLLGENRRLVEDRISLQQELGDAREELRRMNVAIADIQEQNEIHSRNLTENALKLEADLHATKPLKNEAAQLHAKVDRLNSIKHGLSGQVQNLKKGLVKLRSDNKQLQSLKAECERLLQELLHARDAIVYEKKGGMELMEQRQAMEKSLVSMAREVEKLRVELTNTDVGPWGAGGSYRIKHGSSDDRFPPPYGDGYGIHMGAPDKGPLYGSSCGPLYGSSCGPLYGASSGQWDGPEKSRMTRR